MGIIEAQLHADASMFLRSSAAFGSLVLSLIHQLVFCNTLKPLSRSSIVNWGLFYSRIVCTAVSLSRSTLPEACNIHIGYTANTSMERAFFKFDSWVITFATLNANFVTVNVLFPGRRCKKFPHFPEIICRRRCYSLIVRIGGAFVILSHIVNHIWQLTQLRFIYTSRGP